MSAHPKVSVLIPTYNSAEFLDETIQSVLNQSFTDFELIITDNCSTDNTRELVAKYLADERVTYILNESNVGMVGNWNKGLMLAKGEYIKFLMSDDLFEPTLLEKFVAVLEQYSSVSLVSSFKEFFGGENHTFESPLVGLHDGLVAAEHSVLSYNWIGEPSTVMFRKASLWIGNFKTELQYLVDWDMWLRLLKVGDLYVIPESLSRFRCHEGQATGHIKKNYIDIFEYYSFLNYLYEFKFADFVAEEQFLDLKRKAAKDCVNLIWTLDIEGNNKLAERAISVGIKEGVVNRGYVKKVLNNIVNNVLERIVIIIK